MKAHEYERAFLGLSAALLAACLGALLYAAVVLDVHLPGRHAVLDPASVDETAPFDQPGLRQTGPSSYEAVIVGRTWVFSPNEIRVPTGAEVTFVATSADVLHGLHVAETRVNLMLIPGQVTRATYRFRESGEHLMLCHEYCGVGHHTMGGRFIVE